MIDKEEIFLYNIIVSEKGENMKYCRNCGTQVDDNAVICIHCGCAIETNKTKNETSSTLKTVAKVFMLLGCIVSAFFWLIPLCWTIPMTIKYWRDVEYNYPTSTAFKICSLLFVSFIAGILMLCDDND